MNDETRCREFQELLDKSAHGKLSREERLQMEKHAEKCPDCAVLLKMHAHVTAVPGPELESAAPDGMVDTMWRRVMEDLSRRGAGRIPAGSRLRPAMRILVPVLSAAVVILVFISGFLFGELRQLRSREQQLLLETARKDDLISEITVEQARASRERTIYRTGELILRHGLPRQKNFSAGELLSLLEGLPPETTILKAAETESLLSKQLSWRGVSPGGLPPDIDLRDGLQAEEAIRLIEWLKIDPSETISRERLISLSRRRT